MFKLLFFLLISPTVKVDSYEGYKGTLERYQWARNL